MWECLPLSHGRTPDTSMSRWRLHGQEVSCLSDFQHRQPCARIILEGDGYWDWGFWLTGPECLPLSSNHRLGSPCLESLLA